MSLPLEWILCQDDNMQIFQQTLENAARHYLRNYQCKIDNYIEIMKEQIYRLDIVDIISFIRIFIYRNKKIQYKIKTYHPYQYKRRISFHRFHLPLDSFPELSSL